MARKLDAENNNTPCHSEKVAKYAMALCRALNIRGKKKDMIITACLIHDVGKIAVESRVWAKRGRLSCAQMIKARMHPVISAKLARQAGMPKTVVEAIYYHHVWFNGNGYPNEAYKKGKRIPIGARIVAVCDAYDTMMASRPYKEVVSRQQAARELEKFSVKQFDPKIVEIFLRVIIGEADN